MRRYFAIGLCAFAIYLAILGPFSRAMEQKPYAEKLGLIPHPQFLQLILPDYQELLAASILGKVILYYGSLTETINAPNQLVSKADYPAMSRAVHAALRLDPYNMDGYYFGQAILVWDAGHYKLATDLLEYGMQYRTWDWQLPFFAGFDYAYFLKDKERAAKMYMLAGEKSGEPLFKSLAGRYLQEAGDTQMAIDYLKMIEKGEGTPAVKNALKTRILAFEGAKAIEDARELFKASHGSLPADINELVKSRYLTSIPIDPYGGRYYLDEHYQVRTTSKYAFAGIPHNPVQPSVPGEQSQ